MNATVINELYNNKLLEVKEGEMEAERAEDRERILNAKKVCFAENLLLYGIFLKLTSMILMIAAGGFGALH